MQHGTDTSSSTEILSLGNGNSQSIHTTKLRNEMLWTHGYKSEFVIDRTIGNSISIFSLLKGQLNYFL